jgi:hypothetical protein
MAGCTVGLLFLSACVLTGCARAPAPDPYAGLNDCQKRAKREEATDAALAAIIERNTRLLESRIYQFSSGLSGRNEANEQLSEAIRLQTMRAAMPRPKCE